MKRKIYNDLLKWKNSDKVKPLMILGEKYIGKTYIIEQFCQNEFENFVKINLLNDISIPKLYSRTDINSAQKFNYLQTFLNVNLDNKETILFIDEIQESEELISDLKYFCEEHSSARIICAGSLLGVKLKRFKASFPVGKVKMLSMHPMDFEEFLIALNQEKLLDEIKKCYENNTELIDILHNKALEIYKYYLIIGGMPEVVNNFIKAKMDFMKCDLTVQTDIISSYFKDMKKYVTSESESLKINKTYRSVASQIANESKKFQFSKIDKNARMRDYELPLDWLYASGLILPSFRVSTPLIPLKGYVQNDFFKLFINDIGLLNNLLEVKYYDVLSDNLSLYKGAIVENYVATQLTNNNVSLYYWLSSGIAEIDFLFSGIDGVIPIEVKSSTNNTSKSLNTYMKKFNPRYAIRISTKNFGYNSKTKIKSVPLYAAFLIK